MLKHKAAVRNYESPVPGGQAVFPVQTGILRH